MKKFLDLEAAAAFVQAAIEHYSQRNVPPWFIEYLDTDLYIRIHDVTVTIDELLTLQRLYDGEGSRQPGYNMTLPLLYDEGSWQPVYTAVNMLYKLFDRLGRDTSGMSDH